MGATAADYVGGYKGKALRHALSLCVFFGVMATIFSISMSMVFEETTFAILNWMFFFFGSAIMPIGGGILLGSVPKFTQNSASALYCIFQNTIALSLAPIVSGQIMSAYKNKREGMI